MTIKAAAGYCTSGSPPVPVEELTIDLAHEYMLNGSLTCSQLVQAYIQVATVQALAEVYGCDFLTRF